MRYTLCTMKGAHNLPGQSWHKVDDGWLIVGQRLVPPERATREIAWAHDGGKAELAAQLSEKWRDAAKSDRAAARQHLLDTFPPTRWVTAVTDSGITVTGYDEGLVMHLPATVRARLSVTESWGRRSEHEVTLDIVRDINADGRPRAALESFSIRRCGDTPVTAGIVSAIKLGELIDWALTRAPVVHTTEGGYLGPGHPAAAEVVRAAGRRTGKRGGPLVSLEQVAEVARAAPPRRLTSTLLGAFPGVGRRSLMRLLAEARAKGLVEHTALSRATTKED